ncbi:MAG: diacylglycerol kinase [Planctomycetota bacterium]|nr:diacylglycerol kinase [Planctomycetota bacterium]
MRRTWCHKFKCAIIGVVHGIHGHSSFTFHFLAAAVVAVLAVALRCIYLEWCILLLCIGGVMVTELINSAIETFVRGFPEIERERFWPALDVAAGAVLIASGFAVVIGFVLLGRRLLGLALNLDLPS